MPDESRYTALWNALSRVRDPEILRPITELGMVTTAEVGDDGTATVRLKLSIAGCPAARRIESDAREAAESAPGVSSVRLDVGVMTAEERQRFIERVRGNRPPRASQFGPESLTRVFAITSGKGGVGKSSITANLAAALAASGHSVGLIDADVFGFSIPALMGLSRDGRVQQPTRVDELMLPPVAHGVKVISIGMFLGESDPRETAVSWRGPMLHRTIEQFLRDVWFGDLDVLLLDLPPGTGDIAISVGQLLPQAEVIVVTTPQEAAADVAVRSALVARQTGQHVLGVIENMAGFTGPDGSVIDLFGSGGGRLVSDRLSSSEHGAVPLLGSVPLSPRFRELGDAGTPAVLASGGEGADAQDPAALELLSIARALMSPELRRPDRRLAGRQLPITPDAPSSRSPEHG